MLLVLELEVADLAATRFGIAPLGETLKAMQLLGRLVPSVFIWPEWSVKKATSTQTDLWYPARGAGTVWEDGVLWPAGAGAAGLEAAEVLLGVPWVRLALLDQTRIREAGAP